jgi:glycosyltransferase involved in cell wall biosynthesis
MKVLMVFHALTHPPEAGVTKRTFHQLDEISRRHDVTVVSLGSAEQEERIRRRVGDRCRRIVFVDGRAPRWVNLLKRIRLLLGRRSLLLHSFTARLQRALDEVFRAERFDVVFLSSPVLTYYARPAGLPCVTDTHNVEYDMARRFFVQARGPVARAYHWDQYRLLRRDEIAACGGGDALLTCSDRDRDVFRADLPRQDIHVVPNGVDLEYFAPGAEEPAPRSLVFCGLMNYAPNAEGIAWFLDRVFPLVAREVPDARITIVGSGPSKALQRRASDRVVVTGYVPDVRPYVREGEVYVVPLLVGGGTRLKALEAMAMHTPIVTTSVGCEGIDLREGESALFADAPEAFAAAVVRLFRDRALRARLGARAGALAAERYGWQAIGDTLDAVLRRVAARGGRGEGGPREAPPRAARAGEGA